MSPDQIRTFRQLARSKGFSELQISQEIARKQQEESKSRIQPARPVTQPITRSPAPVVQPQARSVGGLVKNAAKDVFDFAIRTPLETAKSAFNLGFEGSRAVDISSKSKQTEKKRKELANATKAFKAEKDPVKKKQLIAKSRLLSDELESINKELRKAGNAKNPLLKPEEVPTLKELGTGILRNLGRTFGIKEDETGNIIFDFETAVQSAYERPVTTALVAKDLTRGIRKVAPKSISGKTAIPGIKTGVGRTIEKQGSELRGGVLNPQAKASPFVSEEMTALREIQSKLGLKGSSQAQLEQLPELFRKSSSEIKTLLKKSKTTKKGALSEQFLKEVDEANYNLADPQFSKAVEAEIKYLSELDGKSPLTQYNALEKYRSLLKSTRKKIDKGTTLLPKEEARLAAFNALKSSIDTVSPEVRAFNTLQNQMYNLSEGLFKNTKKPGFGVGPVRLPTRASQAAQDALGRGLEKAPGAISELSLRAKELIKKATGINIPTGAGITAKLSQSVSDQADQGYGTEDSIVQDNADQGQEIYGDEDIQDTSTISHPVFGDLSKQEVLLDAFKNGLTDKQLTEIETIYDRFAPEGAAVSEDTRKIANDLRQEYISETKNNNFREITNAYKKVVSAPDTAAGDVSLVFAYMKMLDPGSVVREGEFATAENTAGVPERIVNAYNKALQGRRLGPKQRSGFIDASRAAYDEYKSSQDAIDTQYEELATRYGIDPSLLGIGTINIKEK